MNINPRPMHWRLLVFGVPANMAAAMNRQGFYPTKKSLSTWWRRFDPTNPKAKTIAHNTLTFLNEAGLRDRRWDKVNAIVIYSRKPKVGGINFAQHNRASGSYRLKQRRK